MYEPIFLPHPFWFASEEVLADVLRNEIKAVRQLLSKYSDLRDLFDDPAATTPIRKACFMLLVHRKLTDIIDEMFTLRRVEAPSLGDEESKALSGTDSLVAGDAPAWVLEINEVVERLPLRIFDALPEPLRSQGFYPNNSPQVETIKSTAKTLSSVDQIQALTRRVIDQQVRRLERRWSMEGSKSRLKGTKGLGSKQQDLSRYMDNMTEKQQLAFSLKFEHGLGLTKIASEMGINRKTAYEHLEAAKKKAAHARSGEKRKAGRARKAAEF